MKYIDAAYDENTFSKRWGLLLSMPLGLLAGISMSLDQITLMIFLSLIIAVLVTGKLDILPFQILAAIATLIPLAYFQFSLPFSFQEWKLIAVITIGAAIDEVGNDLADARLLRPVSNVFFLYRGYLKMVIVLIAILKVLPPIYAIAFLAFDFGYLLFTRASIHRQSIQSCG